jgi:hypothetical protein
MKVCFQGKREQFEYRSVQQNPMRLKCALIIPVGKQTHEGSSYLTTNYFDLFVGQCKHSLDKEIEHYCETRCPMCDYICEKRYGHHDCHKTSHGNMVNTVFISTAEVIHPDLFCSPSLATCYSNLFFLGN